MLNLLLASLFLPLSHFLMSSGSLRPRLVRYVGEARFSSVYSVLALVTFAWLIVAYHHAPRIALWTAPAWLKIALFPLVLLASILVVAGLTTPNPVIVRSESLFDQPEIVRGVLRITRNPFFWGVGLFSVAHAIMIGEVAATLLFGSVGFLALAGGPILDAKKARTHGRSWDAFAEATSNTPFLAIIRGRQRFIYHELGLWRIGLGVGLFISALIFHDALFGGHLLAAFSGK